MIIKSKTGVVFTCIFIASFNAEASLITDSRELGGQTNLIDFSEFGSTYPHNNDGYSFTSGPLQIGSPVGSNITWSTDNDMSVIGNSTYQLIDNANWNSGRNGFTGLNARTGSMNYYFESPVMGVGGFINYIIADGITTYEDVMISVYGNTNNLIETFNITATAPINTSSDNAGAFRGILLNSPEIFRFEVMNAGVVLDDLQFTYNLAPIPVPPAIWLFSSGIVGLIGLARRKNQ